MKDNRPRIVIVAGPTASGKSDIAIALARKFNGEIISADSRQVYRGMDIGTGKVIKDKLTASSLKLLGKSKSATSSYKLPANSFFSAGIRHHLIDVASPTRQYTVAHFKRDATHAIRDIVRRGKLPIICGGTGFWIDALIYGQSIPNVKPDAKLRARLRKLTATQLFARLLKLDPTRAAAIDRHNPVRLIRALEIVLATGRPVPPRTNGSPYEPLYLGVSRPPDELRYRIEKRLDARLKAGMVAEVRRLHASGVNWKRLESFGLEYRWIARYLHCRESKVESRKFKVKESDSSTSDFGLVTLDYDQMRTLLLRDIIAYAKRQLTWWRRNPNIRWVNGFMQARRLVRGFMS